MTLATGPTTKGQGTPVWDDIASPADLTALRPPRPDAAPRSCDVLVVGGGVVGLSIAAFCRRAGMDVVLIEREERLASGPSGRAGGGLAPDGHPELGPRWRDLARASLDLHRELDAEWGYGLRNVDIRVHPDFVIAGQGHVDPLRFCAALARRAGTVLVGTTEPIDAKHLVVATGNSPHCPASASLVKGHLMATVPASMNVEEIQAPIGVDTFVLQLPDGRLVAGGTKEPGIDDGAVDDAVIEQIRSSLDAIVGGAGLLEVTHRWTCFRPHIEGELPFVQRVDRKWVAAGFHSTGVLMAPVVGKLVAEAIASGADEPIAFR